MMDDLEDIFKAIVDYLREELTLEDDSVISRLNYFIALKNTAKGDLLLESVPNDDYRFVLNQRCRDMKALKNWIDIAVDETVAYDSNYTTVAKTYIVSLSSLISDDLSDDTFYKSLRMSEVLKDIMLSFFKDKIASGFAFGFPESSTLPERVSVEGAKALKSGILYTVTIQ